MPEHKQFFRGKRIYLRELQDTDITERYLSWFKDPLVTYFLEVRDLTYETVKAYIHHGRETGTYFMYAICMIENNLHIGNLKIGPINKKDMISDLVIVIGDRNYWGQGLATEAIRLGNQIAFEVYNIRKLSGKINSANIASIKCYIKAGWVEEGRLKGHNIVDKKVTDSVCVSCFNHKYFNEPKK